MKYAFVVIPLINLSSAAHLDSHLNELGQGGYKVAGMNQDYLILQREDDEL
jgi:hypothetical protein